MQVYVCLPPRTLLNIAIGRILLANVKSVLMEAEKRHAGWFHPERGPENQNNYNGTAGTKV